MLLKMQTIVNLEVAVYIFELIVPDAEIEEINKFRISLWCTTAKFLGYNSDFIMNVVKSYKNRNLSYGILKYKELYSKYNEEYKKFSEIQVTTNKE